VASSIPTYREMQQALLVKSPKRALPVVSGAPATKWQAADRMVKALTDAFMENRRRKEEDAGIAEARSVIEAYHGSGLEEYKPVLPGALSDELLQTAAPPTFSDEDINRAGDDFIQVQELPPVASPMNTKWTAVQDAMDKGSYVSPQDEAELARLQELAVTLSREDSAARAVDDLAARQTHLGRVEEERARMIAQNAADLPGAQVELDTLNQAGEGFRPLTPEELAARNELGQAEWEAANPIGMDAVNAMDLQYDRGKDMRLALMGEQRAIDMGVGDGTKSSMERNVALVKGYKDAYNEAEVALRGAEASGDEEAIAVATGVYNQAYSDYEVVRTLLTRDPQTAGEVAAATRMGADSEAGATERINLGVRASKILPTLRRSLLILENGTKTGGRFSFENATKRSLGIQPATDAELENNLSKAVLSQLRATFGNQFTKEEGDWLKAIEPSWSKSTAANIALLRNAIRSAEADYDGGISSAKLRGDMGARRCRGHGEEPRCCAW
jgi:hypothetical protein